MSEQKLYDRQPGEPLLWYQRFTRFRLMQPVRSVASVYHEEQSQSSHATSNDVILRSKVPGAWYQLAERWHWEERAAAWDAEQVCALEKEIAAARARVFTHGYARVDRRIEDLDKLAESLFAEVFEEGKRWLADVKSVGTGPTAERVDLVQFNSDLIREFRATLADIAGEMGERVKKTELNAQVHSTGQVSVYLPQKYALPPKGTLDQNEELDEDDEEDQDVG